MARSAHNSSRLAKPVGPFSHAVRCGELVYLSGQAGQEPAGGQLVSGGVLEQVRQIFINFRALLEEMGLTFEDVVKVNVFLSSMSHFEAMNQVYAEHFTAPYPARTTVAVEELPMSALVEMEMIAWAH
jgi:2-iminobutanoate/2-iminopropanoate deaminase